MVIDDEFWGWGRTPKPATEPTPSPAPAPSSASSGSTYASWDDYKADQKRKEDAARAAADPNSGFQWGRLLSASTKGQPRTENNLPAGAEAYAAAATGSYKPQVSQQVQSVSGPRAGTGFAGGYQPTEKEKTDAAQTVRTPEGERQIRRLTWEEYYALDDRQRSAVDFNGLLHQAQQADQQQTKTMDVNRDGRVTVSEASKDPAVAGYKAAYRDIFGTDATDDTEYGANTMALLNQLRVKDTSGGSFKDYLTPGGLISDQDLKNTGTADEGLIDPTASAGGTLGRRQMVNNLAGAMKAYEQTLNNGTLNTRGFQVKVSTSGVTDKQRSALVASLKAAMTQGNSRAVALSGEGDSYDPSTGADLSPLMADETRARMQKLDSVYEIARTNKLTDAQLSDRDTLIKYDFGTPQGGETADIPIDEWLRYMQWRKGDNPAMVSAGADDVMNQLGSILGGK